MISMQGVPSALIARNESWVRQQAGALMRRLPSSVEKADLIQAGLIGVAQAALSFKWDGDRNTDEANEAFVRYARMRVNGAMIDELRQMDQLGRSQRRKLKVVQIARERWQAEHEAPAGLAELSQACGISVDEIARLEHAAQLAQPQSLSQGEDELAPPLHPSTPQDEVEARVDTAIVMRRLERFFATLPERDRQVIEAYLGVGISPIELAGSLSVSPSRLSQIYKSAIARIARHFGHGESRAIDRLDRAAARRFAELVATSEADPAHDWAGLIESALVVAPTETRLQVDSNTRWG